MSAARRSFYILIPVISCLLAVLLVEVFLALFFPVPFSLEKNMYFETDPHTGFSHKPLGRGYYPNGVEANANSRGQRDDEVEIPKPAGVFRILLIGDSFTVGANIEQADVYGQVLERLLNEALETPVEVVNAGTGGWNPFQYAQFYEYYGQAFEPDLVLVGFFVGNDTYIEAQSVGETRSAVLGRRVPRDVGQDWSVYARVFLYENSHIARALMRAGPNDLVFKREQCDEFTDYYLAIQAKRMRNHVAAPSADEVAFAVRNADQMARMKALADTNSIPFLLTIFPDENQVNPDLQAAVFEINGEDPANYDFDMPQTLLHGLFTERGIEYLDLTQPLRADPRCLYMNDTHWVTAGHRFVAERIRDYLLYKELVQ